jgi:hypothetical protein
MTGVPAPARPRAARALRCLAAGFASLALLVTADARAQAAALAVPGRATVAATAPAPIPLNTANWSGSAGFSSRAPAWYKDSSGVVHLQGAVKQTSTSGATANQIGTLPRAARPATWVATVLHTFNGTFTQLLIDPNGAILVDAVSFPAVTDWSFVSLEGVTFRPSGPGTPIAVNTANWTGTVTDFRPPAWYNDSSGVIHLQGAASQTSTSGTGANTVGTLPPAARPASTVYTIVLTGEGTYADLAILPDGSIDLINGRPPELLDYAFVSLESISYRPAGHGRAIGVNAANWSPSAGFNSRGPAWYTDRSGVVHLQGAVTQASASGTGANTIGTLPTGARPRHTVYTIVHTFNGTYADLAILPNGDLELIDPRPPMVKDYSFVSLESITYRR